MAALSASAQGYGHANRATVRFVVNHACMFSHACLISQVEWANISPATTPYPVSLPAQQAKDTVVAGLMLLNLDLILTDKVEENNMFFLIQ